MLLDQFKGIQGPSGREIVQIWPKIATKLAEILNFLNNDNLNDPLLPQLIRNVKLHLKQIRYLDSR